MKSKQLVAIENLDKYWDEYLYSYEHHEYIDLYQDGNVSDNDSQRCIIEFNNNIYKKIKEFAKIRKIEFSVLFNAMWGFMLERYNNKKDVVFGNLISIKSPNRELNINVIIPVRVDCTENIRILDCIDKIQKSADSHINNLPSLANNNNLYILKRKFIDHIIAFESDINETDNNIELEYNLFLTVICGESLNLDFRYIKTKYSENSIKNMVCHLERIAEQIIRNPEASTNTVELLTQEEKHKILSEYNSQYNASSKSIVALFKENVKKYPDNIAVTIGERSITYMELDSYSDKFAAFLIKKGVTKESIVAIFAERKIETIVGIVGILKSGGAYLPIDIDYPQERIEYIIENAKVKCIVGGTTSSKVPNNIVKVDLFSKDSYVENDYSIEYKASPNSLAYVMYTSGTTGTPKGVMVEHKSVIRLVKDTNYVEFKEDDVVLQTGSIVFDASTFEIWGALLNGSTLCLIDKIDMLDTSKLKSVIEYKKITIMFLTPSLFKLLVEDDISLFKNVRELVVGGDKMPCKQATQIINKYKGLKLVNGYGPTENTTFSTCFLVDKPYENSIPIGKPITNSTAYIIDCFGNLQFMEFSGELYVGGVGVARGYINNTELTNEKFVVLPFISKDYLYKTGDIVKMMQDGNIMFLDRRDNQVKIRGFRIELNEIENRLLSYEQINDAVVKICSNNNSDKYICAYVTGNNIDCNKVKEYLRQFLPDYMIPNYIITLSNFLLTINGKVDKDALELPVNFCENATNEPINDLERSMCDMWKKILQHNVINVDDDFFEMGGDSLKVMAFISEAQKRGLKLSFTDIYKYTSIRELVSNKKVQIIGIPKVKYKDNLRLSFAQEGIWFNSKIEPIYNVVLSVSINKKPLDIAILKKAIEIVIKNNQELRTIIIEKDYVPYQKVYDEVISDITYEKHLDKTEQELRKFFEHQETYREYKLDEAPLFHFRIGESGDGSIILTIGTHHVLADAYAINIILEEIDKRYSELLNGNEIIADENKTICADYAMWQREEFEKKGYYSDVEYWEKKLQGNMNIIEFPKKENSKYGDYEGDGMRISIPSKNIKAFSELCKTINISMYAGYAALFYIFLNYIYDIDDIAIGTATVGRDRSEIQDSLGNFAFASLIRTEVSKNDSFIELAKKTKKTINELYEHQALPFEMILKETTVDRKYHKLPYRILIEYIKNERLSTNLGFTVADYSNEITPADFTFFIQSEPDEEYLTFYYKRNLFDDEEIEDFVYLMKDIFEEVVNKPTAALKEYDL
ncbi:amino acid adenylation domain-containing protein [Clostridium saccharoperbutylacetonicum]|uniref:amino acid adenylation domain-containing protein n=1 Tax=Clostridium saccharoperbutylacetonicum TaxID=36745 RepID=UPI0039E9EC02